MSKVQRMTVEVAFIIFLFYTNLLMGKFERSGAGQTKGLLWAIQDVFTVPTFLIAICAATVGFIAFELLRKRL